MFVWTIRSARSYKRTHLCYDLLVLNTWTVWTNNLHFSNISIHIVISIIRDADLFQQVIELEWIVLVDFGSLRPWEVLRQVTGLHLSLTTITYWSETGRSLLFSSHELIRQVKAYNWNLGYEWNRDRKKLENCNISISCQILPAISASLFSTISSPVCVCVCVYPRLWLHWTGVETTRRIKTSWIIIGSRSLQAARNLVNPIIVTVDWMLPISFLSRTSSPFSLTTFSFPCQNQCCLRHTTHAGVGTH